MISNQMQVVAPWASDNDNSVIISVLADQTNKQFLIIHTLLIFLADLLLQTLHVKTIIIMSPLSVVPGMFNLMDLG